MRLGLALTEEDPEGKGAEGEGPVRGAGAAIEISLRCPNVTGPPLPHNVLKPSLRTRVRGFKDPRFFF
jgi:hypothetical protein